MLQRISIKSKIVLVLVGVSLISIGVITTIGYRNGQRSIRARIEAQLTSLRAAKARQIEGYFDQLRNQTIILAEDLTIIEALKAFESAFRVLEKHPWDADVQQEWESKLRHFYIEEWGPRLQSYVGDEERVSINDFFPETGEVSARYLQHHYSTLMNPHPLGRRFEMSRSVSDQSSYGDAHARFHPILRDIVEKFGFYDLFLIDTDTGYSVYSYSKEADFASNLVDGPYSSITELGGAVRRVLKSPGRKKAILTDFGPHRASYDRPAAFMASAIYTDQGLDGILIVQIAPEEIEEIMTGGRSWQSEGLGETGETYLVGDDYLMRSTSRFYLEQDSRQAYYDELRRIGVSEKKIRRIDNVGTTILEQEVKTVAVRKALGELPNEFGQIGRKEKTGMFSDPGATEEILDYRGIPVLSSYQRLDIDGLSWVLLAEMDLEEAMAPVREFSRLVLISSAIIMVSVTVLAMWLAEYLVRPIRRLRDQAWRIHAGEVGEVVEVHSQDEIGELAAAFNEMIESLHQQSETIEAKSRESERLIYSLLPRRVARRLQRGEGHIADVHNGVSILFADIVGFTALTRERGEPVELIGLLGDLISAFDEATDRHGVEKVRTLGSSYLAAAGLGNKRLDHARCCVDFSVEMFQILESFNIRHSCDLSLSVGIDSGAVIAGLIGGSRPTYDIWGDAVIRAHGLHVSALSGEILVTNAVHKQVKDVYQFQEDARLASAVETLSPFWSLKPAGDSQIGESRKSK